MPAGTYPLKLQIDDMMSSQICGEVRHAKECPNSLLKL